MKQDQNTAMKQDQHKTRTQDQKKAVAYLPATTVLAEWNRMVEQVAGVGVNPNDTTVGGSFVDWSDKLERGQTAWLYTLEQFRSINELVEYCQQMELRGVSVRSISERWFNDPSVSGVKVLAHLFELGAVMHRRMLATPSTAVRRSDEKQLAAKVKKVVELRATQGLSVVAACRMAGCGVNAYYRLLKGQNQ